MHMSFPRMSSLKTAADFRDRLNELGLPLQFDEVVDPKGALAQPLRRSRGVIGNRFAVLPMEGWDGTADGKPSELTRRRWQRFGQSGAKLIWGGEAVAVRHDGRASPNELVITDANLAGFEALRETLVTAHRDSF